MSAALPRTRNDGHPTGAAARRRRRRRAFTLLELTIALALSATIAVALFQSVSIAFKARDTADVNLEPSRTSQLAVDAVRDDIEAALPPGDLLAGAFVGTSSQGAGGAQADSLSFYAAVPGPDHPLGSGDIKKVEIGVYTPDGAVDPVLVRRVTGNLLAPVAPDPDEEVLCRGVAGFTLRYWDGTAWQTDWDSGTQTTLKLPLAVEVNVDLKRPAFTDNNGVRRFTRVVQLPCYAPVTDTTAAASSSSTGTSGTSGSSGSTGAKSGGSSSSGASGTKTK